MQIKQFLVTVVEDGAGRVFSESRQPLPPEFAHSPVVEGAVGVVPPSAPLPPPAAELPAAQPLAVAPTATKTPLIPLHETDQDVLDMFGKRLTGYRPQHSEPYLENGQVVLHARHGGGAQGGMMIPLEDAMMSDTD